MTTPTPSAVAADGHAILVTGTGSMAPSGTALTGPVDSLDKLAKLLEWAWNTAKLTPAAGQIPQVWIIGPAACRNLGWDIAGSEDLTHLPESQRRTRVRAAALRAATESAVGLIAAGWTVHGGGQRLRLTRPLGDRALDVEIVIATRIAGIDTSVATTGLDLDDPAAALEVGRRVAAWFTRFHVLPAGTGAATGAAIADRIRATRQTRKQGLATATAGEVPAAVDSLTAQVQPRWGRLVDVLDIDGPDAEDLVELGQDAGLLASAGMLTLPVGGPVIHAGEQARALLANRKKLFALWQVTLPPLTALTLPELLPPPDPRMRADAPVTVWVTSPGLDGLAAPATHGGLGLEVEDMEISAAVTWAEQGRALDKWTAEIRDCLDTWTAAGDHALVELATDAWTDYLTHLASADTWQGEGQAHHLQPVWHAALCEHVRFRSRRAMTRIAREFRLHPLAVTDAELTYAVHSDQDLSDPPGGRGRHEVRRRITLTDDGIVQLFLALTEPAVPDTLDTLFGRTASAPEDGTAADVDMAVAPDPAEAPAAATPDDEPEPAEESQTIPCQDEEPEPRSAAAEPDSPQPDASAHAADPAPRAATPRRSTRATDTTAVSEFSGPAAVLDVTGAWLADGTRVDLPADAVHVGDLVAFARTLNLGYRIRPTFVENGQIWITDALATKFGIDATAVTRGRRNDDLRALTATLPFVTLAVAAGWQFGHRDKDDTIALGSWTRVRHSDDPSDEKTSIWVVLMAGFGDDPDAEDPDMPILAGDPSPARIAARLKLFADTLKFPWKMSGPTTGLDILKEARPNTYGPAEWRDQIWAPSTFELPAGAGQITRDFAWTRELTPEEQACTYCHAYDRGGSYTAGQSGLELPIGDPIHVGEGEWEFDAKVPSFVRTVIPPTANWLLPYVLSPAGREFGDEPQWVAGPQFEAARKLGYQLPILEAMYWPEHARLMREWASRFSHAARVLDTDDPDDQAVRAQVKIPRVRGYGMLASQHLAAGEWTPGEWKPYRKDIWALGISKAAANIIHFLSTMYEQTGVAIIAIDKDTIVLASDDPDPRTAWPLAAADAAGLADNPRYRPSFGRGFGQWKPEASGLMSEQAVFFTGGPYKGKRMLTSHKQWMTTIEPA
ncbi:hypothetical protein [Nocardia tengchongensis]|uniref:hypothetical protein n=1 Tax=Nocardia tengchongensis TaxID=2055889 RepID=UPI003668EA42